VARKTPKKSAPRAAARRKGTRQGDLFGASSPAPVPSGPRADERHAAGGRYGQALQVVVPTDTGALTYGVPPELAPLVQPGCRVTVPVRNRIVVGVAWRWVDVADLDFAADKLRPIDGLLDERPLVAGHVRKTLEFLSRYYHCSPGMALRTALAAPLRRTGLSGDDAPARMTWWAGMVEGAIWPGKLRAVDKRVLDKLLARGDCEVKELRRLFDPEAGTMRTVSVPHRRLEELRDQGLIRLWEQRVLRDPLGMREPIEADLPPLATAEQGEVVRRIREPLMAGRYETFVLRGVTGSGKTEVYMRVIAAALSRQDAEGPVGAIVLVPEIALTPQLVRRFRARFGDRIAVLHSALSDGERYDQLTRISTGAAPIVIGPRSALFAPLPRLAVVVLDECHDASFKQLSGVRYHARDVAMVLARNAGAVCVLGSATPGCSELQLCTTGRATRLDMRHRVHGRPLPRTELIDLREAERLRDPEQNRPSLLSRPLIEAIAAAVSRGEQAIVMHNRRGFATTAVCTSCGSAFECPHCAISLTIHRRQGRMRCHYCDHSEPMERSCPTCNGHNFVQIGAGTERLEGTITAAIPGVRVRRFDRDTTGGRRMIATLDAFRRRELDVLVGTQMLAKGHDFPSVTVVGIALAETGLRVPDHLAAERTFQLLTQVAGRAGRGDSPGRVIVQTWAPDHPAIIHALGHDHAAFTAWELEQRRIGRYPPFAHLALLESGHKEPERARQALEQAVDLLRRGGLEVRGPVAAGVAKVRGVSRFHALVRSPARGPLHNGLKVLRHKLLPALRSAVKFTIDIDPTDFG